MPQTTSVWLSPVWAACCCFWEKLLQGMGRGGVRAGTPLPPGSLKEGRVQGIPAGQPELPSSPVSHPPVSPFVQPLLHPVPCLPENVSETPATLQAPETREKTLGKTETGPSMTQRPRHARISLLSAKEKGETCFICNLSAGASLNQ